MNKLHLTILSTMLGLGLASCSVLPTLTTGKKQAPASQAAAIDKIDDVEEIVANAPTANVDIDTEAPTPFQAAVAAPEPEPQPAPVQQAQPMPAAPVSSLLGVLNGEWVIVEAGSHKIVLDDDMPYVNFSELEGRFYASNGCNILNGDFSLDGENAIAFSRVITSLNECPDAKYRKDINNVLRDGSIVRASVEQKGQETYLKVKNNSGKTLLVLRRHNMEVLNGEWKVASINGQPVDIPDANLFLDVPMLTVHGNTGCNFFNGQILIDPHLANSISFSDMAVTMRLCPNSELEMAMLVALEETHLYHLSADSTTLTLLDAHEKKLITLQR